MSNAVRWRLKKFPRHFAPSSSCVSLKWKMDGGAGTFPKFLLWVSPAFLMWSCGKNKSWKISGIWQLLVLLNAGHDKGLIWFRTLKNCGFFFFFLYSRVSQNCLDLLFWHWPLRPFYFQRPWMVGHACQGWKWQVEVKAGEGRGFCSEASGIHGKWWQSTRGCWSHTEALRGRGMRAPVMEGPWHVLGAQSYHNGGKALSPWGRRRN